MKFDYDGGFALNDLAIIEEDTAEAFLGWERLASNNLSVNLGPNRLHMNELVATRPFGKVIIFEDKSVNLQRILRKQPETVAPPKPAAPKPAAREGDEGFPVPIER